MKNFALHTQNIDRRVGSAGTKRRRPRWRLMRSALLVLPLLAGFGASQAFASAPPINLPGLVSETEAVYTPNVVIGKFPQQTPLQVWGYTPLGGVMYACGDFSQVKSADNTITYDRNNLFAFDPFSGAVSDFAPNVDGPVYTCTASPDGQSIYIGGNFDTVNGQPAVNVAEIDVTTGALVPGFNASTDQPVTDMSVLGSRLLISGTFSTVDGQAQRALASVQLDTGAFDPYMNLAIAGRVAENSGLTRVYRFAVNTAGTEAVAIGNFTTVNGVSHSGAFRFTLGASPALIDWDNPWFHDLCGPAADMPVWSRDVQFSPHGTFFVIDGTGGRGSGLCDTASRWPTKGRGVTAAPTWVNHTCVDTLHSVAITDRAVYVQGHQKCVMGPAGHEVPRYGIAALNPKTGLALKWRSDQTRAVGGRFLMVTNSAVQPGFPSGLWSGCDCSPEGGIIFRPLP